MMLKNIETEIYFVLLVLGLCSIIGGLNFIFFDNSFMDAVDFQFILWGSVDSLDAVVPIIVKKVRNKKQALHLPEIKLILMIHFILNVFFVIIGILIFIGIFNINSYNGHGLGVIIQGGFLVVFDTYYFLYASKIEKRKEHNG